MAMMLHCLPSSLRAYLSAAAAPTRSCVRWSSTNAPLMLKPSVDYKRIRTWRDYIAKNIEQRKSAGDVDRVVALHTQHAAVNARLQTLRQERNVQNSGGAGGVDRDAAKRLKEEVNALTTEAAELKTQLEAAALLLPCDTHPASPIGSEAAARTVYVHGERPIFAFPPKDHVTLSLDLGILDLATPARTVGSGFAQLCSDGVRLELALVNWAMDRARHAGFTAYQPPDLSRTSVVEACGFNPRDAGGVASQVYRIENSDLCLIGTGEIPLAARHLDSILEPRALPDRCVAVTHCFRREGGAHGQRDKGLYRLHQFTKVELFAFVNPYAPPAEYDRTRGIPERVCVRASDDVVRAAGESMPTPPCPASEAMLDELLNLQIHMYAELGLHFRVLDMPSEELGASAYRKMDIEAWMPGRRDAGSSESGTYGEISSASNCVDYQARRLGIRTRVSPSDNRHVHTLNATACAVPRVMLALLETHQREDGSVDLPPALWPFMGGQTRLLPGRR